MILSILALAAKAEPAAEQGKLVAANTAFAFDLMNQVVQARPDANVFISPFSVSSALQMTANGAAGTTKFEMQQVLRTAGLPADLLNPAFKALDGQFTGRKDVILNLANGLWIGKSFRLKPAFVDVNRQFFAAELASVDFDSPASARTINDWSDQKTQGKIKQIVVFPFPPLTRLILANAIYFKGAWVEPFKENQTKPREFHLANGPAKQTPMMAQAGHFMYQETADFQAVKLPYKGGLQMELYLPQTNSNPRELLAALAAKGSWTEGVQTGFGGREGTVVLPKFKVQFEVKLNDPLQALGMKSAFGNADFSALADQPLFISEVKQKSFVDVNEEGTEAAAVTVVTMKAMAIMRPPANRFTMILDRPFFFAISDVATGSLLFMGIVNDPAGG
ncbi:MAG: serpin family protein [Verrucomicrobiota bacterium]|jgi:serpin B